MSDLVYLNGDFVKRNEASVSAFDRGFLYGDGLFETIRAYGGTPCRLDEHLERMANSSAELGIPMPDAGQLAEAVASLIERNGLGDAYVRVTVTRGERTGALAPDEPGEPTLLIDARALRPYPAELYERGASVIVSSVTHDSASRLRRHKTTNYLASILAKREATARGADEALLLDAAGHVAEGATSNVFAVVGGNLITPPLDLNILPGVTRAAVIRLARAAGIDVNEIRFGPAELAGADEAFLTNSLMELMPVRSVDDLELPHPVGDMMQTLAAAYRRAVPG